MYFADHCSVKKVLNILRMVRFRDTQKQLFPLTQKITSASKSYNLFACEIIIFVKLYCWYAVMLTQRIVCNTNIFKGKRNSMVSHPKKYLFNLFKCSQKSSLI